MADRQRMLENLERAHGELHAYMSTPVETRRDKAGVIQAFEFTFELFWKVFQKLAPDEGLEAPTPRQALQAGHKMGFVSDEETPRWGQMLRDRNSTSHTYHEALADAVFQRIDAHYKSCFDLALQRLKAAARTSHGAV